MFVSLTTVHLNLSEEFINFTHPWYDIFKHAAEQERVRATQAAEAAKEASLKPNAVVVPPKLEENLNPVRFGCISGNYIFY